MSTAAAPYAVAFNASSQLKYVCGAKLEEACRLWWDGKERLEAVFRRAGIDPSDVFAVAVSGEAMRDGIRNFFERKFRSVCIVVLADNYRA